MCFQLPGLLVAQQLELMVDNQVDHSLKKVLVVHIFAVQQELVHMFVEKRVLVRIFVEIRVRVRIFAVQRVQVRIFAEQRVQVRIFVEQKVLGVVHQLDKDEQLLELPCIEFVLLVVDDNFVQHFHCSFVSNLGRRQNRNVRLS